ncbi:hypothetical protein 2 [Beihai rhabdo-like virus 2]|uniref:Uncharacterized protein n=1 Tax=Beihai rhabdo-like virus 2 TaxID=1922652 RepID=A0A1L3KMM8_9MONO|nr:hypothetical protein 2 [Beihai rhabdo-like virus 2]APG78670.1 hypothetical protein 2 [Beihai rhabdo-like virus 2]
MSAEEYNNLFKTFQQVETKHPELDTEAEPQLGTALEELDNLDKRKVVAPPVREPLPPQPRVKVMPSTTTPIKLPISVAPRKPPVMKSPIPPVKPSEAFDPYSTDSSGSREDLSQELPSSEEDELADLFSPKMTLARTPPRKRTLPNILSPRKTLQQVDRTETAIIDESQPYVVGSTIGDWIQNPIGNPPREVLQELAIWRRTAWKTLSDPPKWLRPEHFVLCLSPVVDNELKRSLLIRASLNYKMAKATSPQLRSEDALKEAKAVLKSVGELPLPESGMERGAQELAKSHDLLKEVGDAVIEERTALQSMLKELRNFLESAQIQFCNQMKATADQMVVLMEKASELKAKEQGSVMRSQSASEQLLRPASVVTARSTPSSAASSSAPATPVFKSVGGIIHLN